MPQDRRRHVRDALVVTAVGILLAFALEGFARWLGIGAPERPAFAPKRSGVFRILALGGSTVLGVPDGASGFVTLLGDQLPALAGGREVEVVNLAHSGAPSSAVLEVLEASADADADLLLVLTGHNEFIASEPGPGLRGALQRLRDGSRLLRALTGAEAAPGPDADYSAPVPRVGPERRAEVSRAFASNLDAIVAIARERGVPLFLCTAPANLADWPPAHRHLAPPAAGGDPDAAMGHYRRGVALRAASLAGEARESFALALDLDPVPRRAFRAMNDAVRAYTGMPGVTVIDVVERFAAHSVDGLVGFELIGDNCHPTPSGNAVIAHEIARAMAEHGLLLSPDASLSTPAAWLARAERRLGGPEQRRRARLRWLLSNAIYALKTPFFNFEASRYYLEQALELAPNDWRVFANLGTLALLEGDTEAGRRALARASALKGAPLDPDDRNLTPYLKEALAGLRIAPAGDGS